MGQYYKFINKTRQEESQISLPFNFGLPYAKSLEHYDDQEVEAMFQFVVKHNDQWTLDDDLVAIGDYGSVISYQEMRKHSDKFGWEGYRPEKRPPKKVNDTGQVW